MLGNFNKGMRGLKEKERERERERDREREGERCKKN